MISGEWRVTRGNVEHIDSTPSCYQLPANKEIATYHMEIYVRYEDIK